MKLTMISAILGMAFGFERPQVASSHITLDVRAPADPAVRANAFRVWAGQMMRNIAFPIMAARLRQYLTHNGRRDYDLSALYMRVLGHKAGSSVSAIADRALALLERERHDQAMEKLRGAEISMTVQGSQAEAAPVQDVTPPPGYVPLSTVVARVMQQEQERAALHMTTPDGRKMQGQLHHMTLDDSGQVSMGYELRDVPTPRHGNV